MTTPPNTVLKVPSVLNTQRSVKAGMVLCDIEGVVMKGVSASEGASGSVSRLGCMGILAAWSGEWELGGGGLFMAEPSRETASKRFEQT